MDDGSATHISLNSAKFWKEKQIQPILFKPNMTHLLQPLDLNWFGPLKKELNGLVWNWQTHKVGNFITKYSVVELLYQATETILYRPQLSREAFSRAGLLPGTQQVQTESNSNLELFSSLPAEF